MKKTAAILGSMPELAPKQIDAVCVLPRDIRHWPVAAASYILAKQAGIELTMRTSTQIHRTADLPKTPLYIVPCLTGWAALYKEAYNALLERAYNDGATVYFSVTSGFINEFEKVSGMRSNGMYNAGGETMMLDGCELPIRYAKKFLLESVGAEVLAKDSTGNPIHTRNKFGKG